MNKKFHLLTVLPLALLAGCAAVSVNVPSAAELDKLTADIVSRSFRAEGVAGLDRLQQDDSNRECSLAEASGQPLAADKGRAIEAANFTAIQAPTDGVYLGDWREGEKIAQNGRGLTWTDPAGSTNGGNCYNCHQISKAEISFGTLGPSLYNYGKLRGVTDPKSAAARPMVDYPWPQTARPGCRRPAWRGIRQYLRWRSSGQMLC
jgi:L-cysteine S-thiosulfotransferase